MLTYGFDIDGVITRIKLLSELEFRIARILWRPRQVWEILFCFSLFFPISRTVRVFIQELYNQGYKIIIVSLRPYFLFYLTEKWLRLNKIPYHYLILNTTRTIDPVEFKSRVIQKFGIDYFFDNSVRIQNNIPNILSVSTIKNKHKFF